MNENGKSPGDLKSSYERDSARADALAKLIIAGLVVEIAGVLVLQKPALEGAVTIVSAALIAIGVWGELKFSHRAREAGDAIVAEAEARAAEATQKAQEAALQLATFRAPRSLNREQTERIAGKMKAFTGTQFAGARSPGNPEFESCLRDIEVALQMAGWTEIDWHVSTARSRAAGLTAIGTDVSVWDVSIGIPLRSVQAYDKAAFALAQALTAEGIAATAGIMYEQSATVIHLMVGPKR
jgi:hypothetical protein